MKFFETFFLDNGGELRFANVVKSFGNGSSNFWTLFEVKNVCVAAKIIANPSDQVLWISGHLSVETVFVKREPLTQSWILKIGDFS